MKRTILLFCFTFFLGFQCMKANQPPVFQTIIDDFEQDMLPSGMDGSIPVGFFTFQGGGGGVSIGITDAPAVPKPGSTPGNQVMVETLFLPSGFAGFIHNFTNPALNAWVSMDWSAYEGIQFWLYGNNTGGELFLDILENRNPGSTSDDAERWTVIIPDDFIGWQFFQFTWDQFTRKEIGNGAPNDGLGLTQVYGYALGGVAAAPIDNAYYLDDVAIWSSRPVPTLGEWGTLSLLLLSLIIGIVAIRKRVWNTV